MACYNQFGIVTLMKNKTQLDNINHKIIHKLPSITYLYI